jgi:hypothetical protein
MGNTSLLTVRGRQSGKPVQTPVSIFVQDQQRSLIVPSGVVNWVRNLRAAEERRDFPVDGAPNRFRRSNWRKAPAVPVFREGVLTGPPGIPTVS